MLNQLLESNVYWREKKGSVVSFNFCLFICFTNGLIFSPTFPRLKQSARIITGSHSKNFSLYNTIFGKVMLLELATGQKPLEINNGDEGLEKRTR